MIVALLAKRPDAVDSFLPLQTRSSISLTFSGTPQAQPFRLPAIEGEKT